MNSPVPRWRWRRELAAGVADGLLLVRYATFVSVAVHRTAIDRYGLPLEHFFIWGDDVEFTARVLRDNRGYLVPESVVYHWTPSPHPAATPTTDRFYYHARNSLLMLRGSSLVLDRARSTTPGTTCARSFSTSGSTDQIHAAGDCWLGRSTTACGGTGEVTSGDEPAPASIVIITQNRKDDLRTSLQSAVEQEGEFEVLVLDDGSHDGTSEMIRSEFPDVRVARFDDGAGLAARRNDAMKLARGDIIVSIDDDAVFTSPRTVADTIADFDHPRIAAVAMPFIDVGISPEVQQQAPDAQDTWLGPVYRGTANAVRRDVLLEVGGYTPGDSVGG